jgi:hypothetical protein
MEMDLIKFNDLVDVINKDLSLYKDTEKGMMFYINTVQLLTRVEPLELDKSQYEIALFEKKIDKLDYKEEFIERPTPKNRITKKDEDKYTLVMEKVKVKKVYNVANALNVKKSFVDKEEAMKVSTEINKTILKELGVKNV